MFWSWIIDLYIDRFINQIIKLNTNSLSWKSVINYSCQSCHEELLSFFRYTKKTFKDCSCLYVFISFSFFIITTTKWFFLYLTNLSWIYDLSSNFFIKSYFKSAYLWLFAYCTNVKTIKKSVLLHIFLLKWIIYASVVLSIRYFRR